MKHRRIKIRKSSRNKDQQLREIYLFVETQAQEVYSYAIWLSGNEKNAEKSIEKALERVVWDVCSQFKERHIKSEFFKALEFECKKEKQELVNSLESKQSDYDQSDIAVSFRKVLDKMPERYSEPLLMRIFNCLSVSELASYFTISESEILMRLSAARRIVSVLVSLELTNGVTIQNQEVKSTPAKYINDLLAGMHVSNQELMQFH